MEIASSSQRYGTPRNDIFFVIANPDSSGCGNLNNSISL